MSVFHTFTGTIDALQFLAENSSTEGDLVMAPNKYLVMADLVTWRFKRIHLLIYE